jgi:hypothetical protein
MTVNDLKAFLDTLPGDMPVLLPNFNATRLEAYDVEFPLMVVQVKEEYRTMYEIAKDGPITALVLSDQYSNDIAYEWND